MVNTAILIGNLGADPEVRVTSGGTRVANFSVATSEKWTSKSGEKQEKTEWHRCVAFDKLAEIIEKYLSKGDRVFIRGKIEYGKYDDKEGVTRYTTDIRVFEMKMLGSPGGAKKTESRNDSSLDNFSDNALAGEDDLPF